MTPTIEDVKRLSIEERIALLEIISCTLREDLKESKKEEIRKPFVIEPVSLEPRADFDFDNIGKLLGIVEGEFYR